MSEYEAIARKEVEEVHDFLVGWFTGSIPESDFEPRFLDHMDHNLLFIPPAGTRMDRDTIAAGIRQGYGTNPEFRIQIRDVKVRHVLDNHMVVTYEEWQRNAGASKPSDNGRISTILLTVSEPLRWLVIHETWLPDAVMAADPYDF